MIKNRVLIIAVIILMALSLFLIIRVSKKGVPSINKKSEPVEEQVAKIVNINSYLQEADAFIARGSLLEAKEIYQRLMEMQLSSNQLSAVQSKLEDLNIKILLSGINIKQSQIYEVKSGDTLTNISKQFNTTVNAIVKSNNISENLIRPGMKLRILNGKFSVFVDKSQNILILKFNDEIIKNYSVATGKNNSTPVGTYKIINKLVDPVWYKDGVAIPPSSPENILGSRWMGFDLPEYGIHGTTNPEQIGMQITDGCVRMRNKDVEELYDLLPVNTEATIID